MLMSLCLTPGIPTRFKGMKKMVVLGQQRGGKEHDKDQKQPKSRLVRDRPRCPFGEEVCLEFKADVRKQRETRLQRQLASCTEFSPWVELGQVS